MTEEIIARRLPRPLEADRVILPGRCRADLAALTPEFGVPFERGPDEIADLPAYLGRGGARAGSLAPRHAHLRRDRRCVDAERRRDASRARGAARRGADVIDLGCLPDTPFPHLEEAVAALQARA